MKAYPLTNSQSLIWTGHQLAPDSPQYNMAFAFEFNFALDFNAFHLAFREYVAASDNMRSVFVTVEGVPRVIYLESIEFEIPYFENSIEEANAWMKLACQSPFNLAEKLFEVALFKHGENHYTWYFNQHHLITDGWSFTLQYEHIMDIYFNKINGSQIETKIPSVQEIFQSKAVIPVKAIAHWRSKISEDVSLPTFSENQSEIISPNSRRIYHQIDNKTVEAIKKKVSAAGLRTWSTDLGVFNFLLTVLLSTNYKLTSSRKVTIGTPGFNRKTKVERSTPGLFIEMFPISAHISTGETYVSLYQKISRSANEFLRYGVKDASFPELVKSFNSVLNFINARFKNYPSFPMRAKWLHAGANDASHHLSLQVSDFNGTGTYDLAFDFNSKIFANGQQDVIDLFFKELTEFLESEHKLLRAEDHQELLKIETFNKTTEVFPARTYLDDFAKNVKEGGDRIALKFDGQEITFQQLDEQSNRLAHYLIDQGIRKEQAVGVCLDRSFEMVISIIAIHKSGGAYVPIATDYPQKRCDFIIDDADIPLVLCLSQHQSKFKRTYVFDVQSDDLNKYPSTEPSVKIDTTDLMYIIYTSGSTGQPKGVMNEHGGVYNRLYWGMQEYDLNCTDSILLKTSFTFDVSVIELLSPLIIGCTMVIAKPDGHRDPDYLRYILASEKISYVHFVPPMLEIFMMNLKGSTFPHLKMVACSGEALLPTHVNSFNKLFKEVKLYNLYGPTEAGIEVTYWIAPNEHVEEVTIGKPISNVKLKVVDNEGLACGIGVPGELLLGGVQVSRGYRNKEELTQQKFFTDDVGVRWYRTGDLSEWMSNGEIKLHGRIDQQIKLRGFRIELGEIEEVARTAVGISQSVALIENQQIYLFVVGQNHNHLQDHLALHLPEYMMPSSIILVDEIPFLINEKIDRKALLHQIEKEDAQNDPEGEFEKFVYDIWKKVLKVNAIGVRDDFFRIGGDSLSGIRIMTIINHELDLDLPVVLIFKKSTIAEMATYIEAEIDRRIAAEV